MFSKDSFRNTIRVSKSLDPDQAGHFDVPDLVPNCLQRFQLMTLAGKGLKTISLFCCFTSQSTAMVITGRSVHLTTLFPGQA